ncbi:MAG: hypothetical protein ACRDTC_00715 [Pseudonocardiaceae bacterium]
MSRSTFSTWRPGHTAAMVTICIAVLVLSGCGSPTDDEAASGGAPSGAEDIRVVDLLDTTFDLGALGIAPVAVPFLDRRFAERVLAELELPADIEQQILAAELVNSGDGISTERVAAIERVSGASPTTTR